MGSSCEKGKTDEAFVYRLELALRFTQGVVVHSRSARLLETCVVGEPTPAWAWHLPMVLKPVRYTMKVHGRPTGRT